MRFRKLRIAWSVCVRYRVRVADRVVGAELLAGRMDAGSYLNNRQDLHSRLFHRRGRCRLTLKHDDGTPLLIWLHASGNANTDVSRTLSDFSSLAAQMIR